MATDKNHTDRDTHTQTPTSELKHIYACTLMQIQHMSTSKYIHIYVQRYKNTMHALKKHM